MRWLMWIAIGSGMGCAIGAYFFRGMGLLLAAGACLLGLIPAVVFRNRWKYGNTAIAVFAGLVLGCGMFFGYDSLYVAPARALDGSEGTVTLRVSDECRVTEYGYSVDGTVELSGKRYKMRLYLDEGIPLSPGDSLTLPVRFRLTDEGGQSEPTYHRTNGILLLGYQQDRAVWNQGTPNFGDVPGILRQRLKERMDALFPEDTRGFARALLLGDKSALPAEVDTTFRLCGVSHIVAVSGLHISILFALVQQFGGKRRFLTALLGIPVVLLFAAVAGFTPSVTRAAVMQVLMLLALVFGREYDPATALGFAALMILGQNPLTVASAGFQMSVGCVAGILLFREKIGKYLMTLFGAGVKQKTFVAKRIRGMITSVSVGLSAMVFTAPLVAWYFGVVSLVSVLANLLVVPVVSVVFYGILLACLAGAWIPVLGTWIGWLVSWLIRYTFAVTRILAAFPLAAVYTESVYICIWLVLVYGLILWIILMKPERLMPGVCCAVGGLCLALLFSWSEPLLDDYRVTVLDVGQGQCLLLQSRGNTFLVDCGGTDGQDAGDKAADHLLSMGISRIDGLVLTHYDRDHVGGVPWLARRVEIGRIYLPLVGEGEPDPTEEWALSDRVQRFWVEGDMEITFRDCRIRLFAPEYEKSGNESSIAVLFQNEKYDTLITGDMSAARERELLEKGVLPDLELLVAGHHGSGSSTSAELVYRTAPDLVLISVGADNSYGHPAPSVLNRLELYGCTVYRTDLDGNLIFRG